MSDDRRGLNESFEGREVSVCGGTLMSGGVGGHYVGSLGRRSGLLIGPVGDSVEHQTERQSGRRGHDG